MVSVDYSYSQLSTASQAAFAADKPLLLGKNAIARVEQPGGVTTWTSQNEKNGVAWRTWDQNVTYPDSLFDFTTLTINSNWNVDAEGIYGPASRVRDHISAKQSYGIVPATFPGGATSNDRFAFFANFVKASYYAPSFDNQGTGTVDTVAIFNHNFGDLTNTFATGPSPLYVDILIANDTTFSDAPANKTFRIFRWTNPTTNRPLIAYNLKRVKADSSYPSPTGAVNYEQYTNLGHLQISVHSAGKAMTGALIGELIAGPRLQMLNHPIAPYRDKSISSDVDDTDLNTGQFNRFVRSSGRRILDPSFHITTQEGHDDFLTFFQDHINYGKLPFLYSPRPSTNESNPSTEGAYLVTFPSDVGFSLPHSDPFDWRVHFELEETAKYFVNT